MSFYSCCKRLRFVVNVLICSQAKHEVAVGGGRSANDISAEVFCQLHGIMPNTAGSSSYQYAVAGFYAAMFFKAL